MSDNRISAQIDGSSKQQILQAAQDEMARYEKQLRDQAYQKQKSFHFSATFLLLLLFLLVSGFIVSVTWHKPATAHPSPDTRQQDQLK